MDRNRAAYISALTYTAIATLASSAFLVATVLTGDYTWVARIGGAGWVFLLGMIILMPTVTPWVKTKLQRPRDAQAQRPEEATMAVPESTSSGKGNEAKDPVCGMSVDPVKARWVSEYQGAKYYFCANGCKNTSRKGRLTTSSSAAVGDSELQGARQLCSDTCSVAPAHPV